MTAVTTFLWYSNNKAQEAAELYTSVLPDSKILSVQPGPEGIPMGVTVQLVGQEYILFNGGPHHTLNEATSIFVNVEDQAEVDEYWDALTADGGEESQCGWLKDKFGLSWQIVPKALFETIQGPDPEGAGRAVQAMLGMRKLDVQGLKDAYAGN